MGPPQQDFRGLQASNRGARGGFNRGRGVVRYNIECFIVINWDILLKSVGHVCMMNSDNRDGMESITMVFNIPRCRGTDRLPHCKRDEIVGRIHGRVNRWAHHRHQWKDLWDHRDHKEGWQCGVVVHSNNPQVSTICNDGTHKTPCVLYYRLRTDQTRNPL